MPEASKLIQHIKQIHSVIVFPLKIWCYKLKWAYSIHKLCVLSDCRKHATKYYRKWKISQERMKKRAALFNHDIRLGINVLTNGLILAQAETDPSLSGVVTHALLFLHKHGFICLLCVSAFLHLVAIFVTVCNCSFQGQHPKHLHSGFVYWLQWRNCFYVGGQ